MSSNLVSAHQGVGGTALPKSHTGTTPIVSIDGGVMSIRLGRAAQLGALAVAASLLSGAGVVGAKLGLGADPEKLSAPAHGEATGFAPPSVAAEAALDPTLEELRTDYETRLAHMSAAQLRLEVELQKARQRRETAVAELKRKERALTEASAELDLASRELDQLRAAAGRNGQMELGSTEALASAESELAQLRLRLAEAERSKEGLARTLDAFTDTMEKVIAERDDAAAKAENMDERLAAISEKQDRLIGQLEEAARVSLDGMKRMLESSDLDVDRILDETRQDYTGAGGPFEALGDAASDQDAATELRVAALVSDLEEVNLMRFAAQRMPFGMPVYGARQTSHFGPRRDPLGRGRALHKGVDFAGPKGTPIYATADGVVTFSGRQRGYGNIVVITHPFGIETRYAHLNRSHVTVGQRVKRGDRIADMGNTGRSTGTHLHYEVRIDREAVNPSKFIEAGHDVL